VGRVLQIIASYALSQHRLRPPLTTSEHRAVRRTLRQLETDEALPGPVDYEALLSPPAVGVAWARQVEDYRLWILYRFDDQHVSLREIAERAPVRVDD
jgi:hypothetical protein